MIDFVAALCLLAGGLFALLGAVGVLRMPDLYCRMQSTTKATTLGVGLVMIANVLERGDSGSVARGLEIIVFVYLTAPIGAHMLSRAAHRRGVRGHESTIVDDLDKEEQIS